MDAALLDQLTVKELRALASQHNIPGRSKLRRRVDLLDALHKELQSAGAPANATPDNSSPPAAPTALSDEFTTDAHSSISSASTPTQTDKQEHIAEPGLPIPPHYGSDRLVLMPQDPHHIYAYWELQGGALERARGALGEEGQVLLIIHCDNDSELRSVDPAAGNYYCTVEADRDYRAELALRGSDGRLQSLIASEHIRTPPDRVSDQVASDWMAVDAHFDELTILAGNPGAGHSSADLISERIRTRLWQKSGIFPEAKEHWSSGSLSSGALSSGALASGAWRRR